MKILKISFEKQDFWKVWMKCLEIARLQDFAPNTPGFLGGLVSLPRGARFAMLVDEPPSGNLRACNRQTRFIESNNQICFKGMLIRPLWINDICPRPKRFKQVNLLYIWLVSELLTYRNWKRIAPLFCWLQRQTTLFF